MAPTKTKKKVTARQRRVGLFAKWLLEQGACDGGMRFCKGLTVHEAWNKAKTERHATWMKWLIAGNPDTALCRKWYVQIVGGMDHSNYLNLKPAAIMKLVKLPRTFDWER